MPPSVANATPRKINLSQRKGEGRQFFPYGVAIAALCADFTTLQS
jgi:hypothetical protein